MDNSVSSKKLTIILPVYNEVLVVEKALGVLASFLIQSPLSGLKLSIIVADNKSYDGTMQAVTRMIRDKKWGDFVFYHYIPRKGRGNAIKEICKLYKSDAYLYLDIDLPIELHDIENLVRPVLLGHADLCVVRRINTSRPLLRKLFTKAMSWVNKILLNFSYEDVQSGAKSFSAEIVNDVLFDCKEEGYFLDTELVAKSIRLGFKVLEVDARWIDRRFPERQTKVNLAHDALKAFKAILRVFISNECKHKSFLLMLLISFLANTGVWLYIATTYGNDLTTPLNPAKYNSATGVLIPTLVLVFATTILMYRNLPISLHRLAKGVVLITFTTVLVCIFFTKPIYSQDVYWNLLMAKGFSLYKLNPYATTPENMSFHNWSQYVGAWRDMTLSHGPLSPLIHYSATLASDINTALLILRTVFALGLVLCLYVYTKLVNRIISKEKHLLYITMFALNPFILLNTVFELHIDVFIMLFIVSAYYLLMTRRYIPAVVLLALAAAIKYLMIFTIIPVIFGMYRSYGLSKTFFGQALSGLTGFLLTFGFLYLPFGYGPHLFSGLFGTQLSVSCTICTMPVSLVIMSVFNMEPIVVKFFGLTIFVASTFLLSIKRWYHLAFVLPYVLLFVGGTDWLYPWYFLWFFPLLLLLLSKTSSIFWVSAFLLLSVEGIGLLPSLYIITTAYFLYRLVREVVIKIRL